MGNKISLDEEVKESILDYDCSAWKIAQGIKDGKYQKIVVLNGAGISVSAGIPDFRTPGTGIYDNIKFLDLPTPESVFDLSYFKHTKGAAFYKLAKEMWPDNFSPTPAHLFIRILFDE